jgi:large subunit ribosomal protein L4
MKVDVTSVAGKKGGTVELPDDLFGVEPNIGLMHQVVTAQLAHRRAGTHSTKTRAEVAGGGAKPWRQKGTGRARQGSIRSPQWRGGGIAHGPKPRDYSQRTPKKMVRAALRSALSDRASEGRVKVVDSWGIDEPQTKQAITVLETLGLRPAGERAPRVLIVLDRAEHAVWKSFRNLGSRVQIVLPDELNPYDILVNDWIVFSQPTLDAAIERFADKPETDTKPATATKAPAASAPADEAPAPASDDAEDSE